MGTQLLAMRLRATLLLLSLGFAPVEAAFAQDRVFLLGGQSNMAGFGTSAADLPQPYGQAQPQVRIWNFLEGDWADLAPGFGAEFGPELSFGLVLAQQDAERTVYLIKHAVNGTSLHEDWKPGSGFQWSLFRSVTLSALAKLQADGVDYRIEGMLWMQGESDALEGQGAAYEQNLRDFIDAVRSLSGKPELPFVLGRIAVFFGDAFNNTAVRSAQELVADSTPEVTWFDTDDLELVNFGHYDSLGQVELGQRFADGWLALGAGETWNDLGFGVPGAAGIPTLSGSGTLAAGEPVELNLTGAPAATPGLLLWSDANAFLPILGGLVVPDPFDGGGWWLATTDAIGSCAWGATWPAGVPTGLELSYQALLPDPGASAGWTLSNAVLSRTP